MASTREYIAHRRRKAELEAELREVNRILDEMQDDLIEQWNDAGRTAETMDGYMVFRHRQLWASMREGARDDLVVALRESGRPEMTTVNHQTLSSFVRESLEQWAEAQGMTREDASDLIAEESFDWDQVLPGIGRFIKASEKTTLNMRKVN